MNIDQKPFITVFVYACDLRQAGAALGKESIARLEILRGLAITHEIAAIVFTAGYSPKKWKYPAQKRSMAVMMERWVRRNLPSLTCPIITDGASWGTVGETSAAVRLIKKHHMPRDIYIVTSDYHVPRVQMCWFAYSKWNWRHTFRGAYIPKPYFWRLFTEVTELLKMFLAFPEIALIALTDLISRIPSRKTLATRKS